MPKNQGAVPNPDANADRMNTYIALLRGINIGATAVKTYIQLGRAQ